MKEDGWEAGAEGAGGGGLLMLHPNFAEQINQMKQQCRVCEEPAAGFHFGAFTCEGCKSFFGRCAETGEGRRVELPTCKARGQCSVLGRARTNCKACRFRKCRAVGMSRERSRFGRRSHYFKVHQLIQQRDEGQAKPAESLSPQRPTPPSSGQGPTAAPAPATPQGPQAPLASPGVPLHKPLAILTPSPLAFLESLGAGGVFTPLSTPLGQAQLHHPLLYHLCGGSPDLLTASAPQLVSSPNLKAALLPAMAPALPATLPPEQDAPLDLSLKHRPVQPLDLSGPKLL